MDESQVATNARVIMINPLSYNYPQVAIHIQVICFLLCYHYTGFPKEAYASLKIHRVIFIMKLMKQLLK